MRSDWRRAAVRGRRWRRLVRRTVLAVVVLLGLSLAGPQAQLTPPGTDPLPLSWLTSWFALPAGWASPPLPPTPVQGSAGSAAGKAHAVPASATRANRGP